AMAAAPPVAAGAAGGRGAACPCRWMHLRNCPDAAVRGAALAFLQAKEAGMLRTLWVTMLLLGTVGGAVAQSPPVAVDGRCWHGSQSYSEGSLVRVGGRFYACGGVARWEAAEAGGANCVYEDRNYSSGALV